MSRILVVDDNVDIRENVRDYLSLSGFDVETAGSGEEADKALSCAHFELVLLDVGLPDIDGFALCRRWRKEGFDLPIVMLTARDAIDERCSGLAAGADDYVVKPFSLRELKARIEAHLRRYVGLGERLVVGDLTLDLRTKSVERAGVAIKLAPNALVILEELMRRSPATVSRERLSMLLWGGDAPDTDALRSTVYQLRVAVDKPFKEALIHTRHRIGWFIGREEAAHRSKS